MLLLISVHYLEDFKSSDVQDSNEGCPLPLCSVKGSVDSGDKPPEHPLVQSLRHCFHRKFNLFGKKQKAMGHSLPKQ